MKRVVFITTLFYLLSGFLSAQTQYNYDSLEKSLKTPMHDTSLINNLLAMGLQKHYTNLDSAETVSLRTLNTINTCLRKKNNTAVHKRLNYQKGEIFNLLGVIYDNKGFPKKGLEYYIKCKDIFQKIGDCSQVCAQLNNIGYIYLNLGDYKTAISYFNKSISELEVCKENKNTADCYNNLGYAYWKMNDFKKAFLYFEKSLVLKEKSSDLFSYAGGLHNIGVCYDMSGDSAKAWKYLKQALALKRKLNDKKEIAYTLNELAYMHKRDGRYEIALQLYKESVQSMREVNFITGISTTLGSLGHLYILQNKFKEAEICLNEALIVANQNHHLENKKGALKLLVELYYKMGNYKKAFDVSEEYHLVKDSIYNDNNQKALMEQEAHLKYEKKHTADSIKNKEKEKLNTLSLKAKESEIKRQKTQNIALGVGMLLLLALSFVIFRAYKSKQKAHTEISNQKLIIQEKNNEIIDSITYAKHLQDAIMPKHSNLSHLFSDSFIYYKPKDIVAGDFVWFEKSGSMVIVAVADCTGHGVPGAMLTIVGANALKQCVKEFKLWKPNEILDKLSILVSENFAQKENENSMEMVRDGMDISICAIDKEKGKLYWSGANNPLVIVNNSSTEVLNADKQSIGDMENRSLYTLHEKDLQSGDVLFMFSDGYSDQFGGDKGKKYKFKSLCTFLEQHANKPLTTILNELDKEFNHWKRDFDQTDDVCVVGIKV